MGAAGGNSEKQGKFFAEVRDQLAEAVAAEIELRWPANPKDPESKSRREALEDLERARGERSPKLDSVVIPEGYKYLFDHYFAIRAGAEPGFSGVTVTWATIAAYGKATGIEFSSWEAQTMIALDKAAAKAIDGLREKPKNGH